MSYCKSNRPLDAEKVLRESIKEGLKPDAVCYSTVIDAYKRVRNYDKCWELFEHFRIIDSNGKDADEFMLS